MTEDRRKWVALLRGVNVGGHNKVPMADLRALAEGLGRQNVRSYIASGNLVFEAGGEAEALAHDLRQAMVKAMAVDVPVLALSGTQVVKALRSCPWDVDGKTVHLFWCWADVSLNTSLRDSLIASDEEVVQDGRLVWLYAPSGVGRSKLAARMEQVFGGQATARNLNTLRKLAEMVEA